jgi:hypothetical protein
LILIKTILSKVAFARTGVLGLHRLLLLLALQVLIFLLEHLDLLLKLLQVMRIVSKWLRGVHLTKLVRLHT